MAGFEFNTSDLVRGMARASDDIKREVGGLIDEHALLMKARVQAAYPVGPTGRLRGQVYLTQPRGFSTASAGLPVRQVRASAPHVYIYQEGTRERFDATRKNARRGRSPAHGRIFERIAATTRAQMLLRAQQILDRPRDVV